MDDLSLKKKSRMSLPGRSSRQTDLADVSMWYYAIIPYISPIIVADPLPRRSTDESLLAAYQKITHVKTRRGSINMQC